jgi:hypothetical protein
MTVYFYDMVMVDSVTPGGGPLTWGSSVTGPAGEIFLAPPAEADGKTVAIRIFTLDQDKLPNGDWEICLAVVDITHRTFSRGTFLSSSTGSRVIFPSGLKYIEIITAANALNSFASNTYFKHITGATVVQGGAGDTTYIVGGLSANNGSLGSGGAYLTVGDTNGVQNTGFVLPYIGELPTHDPIFFILQAGPWSTLLQMHGMNGRVGWNLPSTTMPSAHQHFVGIDPATTTQIIQAAAAQTADLTHWQDTNGNVVTTIRANGWVKVGTDRVNADFDQQFTAEFNGGGGLSLGSYRNSSLGANITITHHRGTMAAPLVSQVGDQAGNIYFNTIDSEGVEHISGNISATYLGDNKGMITFAVNQTPDALVYIGGWGDVDAPGGLGIGTGGLPQAKLHVANNWPTFKPFIVQSYANQTANIAEFQNPTGQHLHNHQRERLPHHSQDCSPGGWRVVKWRSSVVV